MNSPLLVNMQLLLLEQQHLNDLFASNSWYVFLILSNGSDFCLSWEKFRSMVGVKSGKSDDLLHMLLFRNSILQEHGDLFGEDTGDLADRWITVIHAPSIGSQTLMDPPRHEDTITSPSEHRHSMSCEWPLRTSGAGSPITWILSSVSCTDIDRVWDRHSA